MSATPTLVPFTTAKEIEAALSGTIAHLHAHRVLAYPTETVYGLGGAIDRASVEAVTTLKQRPANKPILILISNSEMLNRLGLRLPLDAERLAALFWPGPLTLVLPGGGAHVPDALRGPEGGVAVRWTPHPGTLRLLEAYGAPITSSSANHSGGTPAISASAIQTEWRNEIEAGLIRVLDGGLLPPSPPSTVVDCIGSRPRLIRAGAISVTALREAVPALIAPSDS